MAAVTDHHEGFVDEAGDGLEEGLEFSIDEYDEFHSASSNLEEGSNDNNGEEDVVSREIIDAEKARDIENDMNRKKKLKRFSVGISVLLLIFLIIALSVGLTASNKRSSRTTTTSSDDDVGSQNAIVSQEEEDLVIEPPTTSSPTLVPPTSTPTTKSPTQLPTTTLFNNLVESLKQYTSEGILLDQTTPQGQALAQLYDEAMSEESNLVGDNNVINTFRLHQRYALMVLYLSTSPWSISYGWNTSADDECSWYGIGTCRQLDDHDDLVVTNIQLESNGLSGDIPYEICALSDQIEVINFADNALTGVIPSCIVGGESGDSDDDVKLFVHLEDLSLRSNTLTSTSITDNSIICKQISEGTLQSISFDCDVACECCGVGTSTNVFCNDDTSYVYAQGMVAMFPQN